MTAHFGGFLEGLGFRVWGVFGAMKIKSCCFGVQGFRALGFKGLGTT